MAAYGNNAVQLVNPGEDFTFSEILSPCVRKFIRFRQGESNFVLSGWLPQQYRTCGCRCGNDSAEYLVQFGANVQIPEGGTVAPIEVALTVNGSVVPLSRTIVTPTGAEEYFNVSKAIPIDIWRNCCQNVTLRNVGTEPIQAQNSIILFSRPDLAVTY